jgi:glyoxylase-like metal-dependent hydrolase (beta-lactamase superfamily II)
LFKWTWGKYPSSYKTDLGQHIDIVCYIWYLEGSDRVILVDAGATAEMFKARYGLGEHIQTLEQGLSRAGLKATDVDTVILTHLHWDHVALAAEFPRATFLVQKAEWEFAKNPPPSMAIAFDQKLFKDLNVELVEGNREVIEGVDIMFTPGHTPGGQSVAVETPRGLAIITGFCCTWDNFEPPSEVGSHGVQVVSPSIHINVPEVYDSAMRIKELADRIIPLHEAEFMNMEEIS